LAVKVERFWKVLEQLDLAALHGTRQPSVPIQPATARPISSGESSWTKWSPATVTSVERKHAFDMITISLL
jgi:hypothetical protein